MNRSLERVLLIVNPAAQSGRGRDAGELARLLLEERLGAGHVECALTGHAGHARELAADARGFDAVVALGGDGVIHEAAGGLMRVPAQERPAFGVVPVGSGNDYARTLGMSQNVERAVEQLASARPRPLDVGECNGEFFVETLSFGLDAAIALDTVTRRVATGKQGAALYLASGIDQLLHHLDSYHVRGTLDGRPIEADVLLVAVQIGPTYGGGWRICPDARPDDGAFDLCWAATPLGTLRATYIFLRAKNAHHVKYRQVRFDRASRIYLEFDRRPPCQMDGEAHVADAYDISMHPGALQVLVP